VRGTAALIVPPSLGWRGVAARAHQVGCCRGYDRRVVRIARWSGLVAFVLAGCAAVPPASPTVPAGLRPYADVARFLLPGSSSVAFSVHELHSERAAPGATRVARRAFCGSDFEPTQGFGYGRYHGIEVWDFGAGGLRGEQPEGEPAASIGGVLVWHGAEERRPDYVVETWICHVDDRFVVSSHDRDLLERALARTGDVTELLRPFAAVQLLPEDADSVVCLQPRHEDRNRYWVGRPIPTETTVAGICGAPPSLLLFHRQPLPAQFVSFGSAYADSPPVTTSRDGWQVTTMVLRVDATERMLLVQLLSGLDIFI